MFDGAEIVGPDGESFSPPGIYRAEDFPGVWCDGFLDFDDVANANEPRTPGAANGECYIGYYGEGCVGDAGFTPRLQMAGVSSPGGRARRLDLRRPGRASRSSSSSRSRRRRRRATVGCQLLVGPAPLFATGVSVLPGAAAGEGDITFTYNFPASALAGTVFTQAFCGDTTTLAGFTATNGVKLTVHN